LRELNLWETYTREEAHDIFDPEGVFTPQTGTWGLQGIIRLPGTTGDFVFFVTFGAKAGDHDFEEEISEDGVLTWQSQPAEKLKAPRIQKLIAHNDLTNRIHLFLRTDPRNLSYTYFGELGYLDHDPEREAPVYFTWQLMDWPAPAEVLATLEIAPTAPELSSATTVRDRGQLTRTDPPPVKPPGAAGRHQGSTQPILPGKDARNRKLGTAGELLVLRAEQARLHQAGRGDLASRIVHVSIVEGDSAGYDIRSFNIDGTLRHIEVKATQGAAANAFFASPNEIRFSEDNPDTYVLLRVYGYDYSTDSGSYFEVPGPLSASFALTATEFRARLLPSPSASERDNTSNDPESVTGI
jgi:hypothetical protein